MICFILGFDLSNSDLWSLLTLLIYVWDGSGVWHFWRLDFAFIWSLYPGLEHIHCIESRTNFYIPRIPIVDVIDPEVMPN